jgi:hypothetical protein
MNYHNKYIKYKKMYLKSIEKTGGGIKLDDLPSSSEVIKFKTNILDDTFLQNIIKCKHPTICVNNTCTRSHDCSLEDRFINSFYDFINKITKNNNPIENYILQIINIFESGQWTTNTKILLQNNIDYVKKIQKYNIAHMDEIQLIIKINEANISDDIYTRDELYTKLQEYIKREINVKYNTIFTHVGLGNLLNDEFIKTINDIIENDTLETLPIIINDQKQVLKVDSIQQFTNNNNGIFKIIAKLSEQLHLPKIKKEYEYKEDDKYKDDIINFEEDDTYTELINNKITNCETQIDFELYRENKFNKKLYSYEYHKDEHSIILYYTKSINPYDKFVYEFYINNNDINKIHIMNLYKKHSENIDKISYLEDELLKSISITNEREKDMKKKITRDTQLIHRNVLLLDRRYYERKLYIDSNDLNAYIYFTEKDIKPQSSLPEVMYLTLLSNDINPEIISFIQLDEKESEHDDMNKRVLVDECNRRLLIDYNKNGDEIQYIEISKDINGLPYYESTDGNNTKISQGVSLNGNIIYLVNGNQLLLQYNNYNQNKISNEFITTISNDNKFNIITRNYGKINQVHNYNSSYSKSNKNIVIDLINELSDIQKYINYKNTFSDEINIFNLKKIQMKILRKYKTFDVINILDKLIHIYKKKLIKYNNDFLLTTSQYAEINNRIEKLITEKNKLHK